MKIAIIGRSEILYETALFLSRKGHEIVLILTAKETSDYSKGVDDFKRLSELLSAKFIYTPSIEKAKSLISSLGKIDIGVSYNYVDIIPQDVIDLFELGILNAHGGDLPRYRGNACQAWAILQGEKKIGLCIYKMIGGELDNGDIISRDYIDIAQETKITAVHKWMRATIPSLFHQAIDKLDLDKNYLLEKQSIESSEILRTYPRQPDDGRILWGMSAHYILRLINASNKPYSGAFFYLNDKKITVWDAKIVDDNEVFLAIPGQITKITKEFIEVACGRGKLRLTELEQAGNIIKYKDFFKSLRARLS